MKFLQIALLALAPILLAEPVLACTPDAQTLCLANGRFDVTIEWSDVAGNPKTLADADQTGAGTAHTLTDDTGTFWLFDDQHYEVLVKVLDACSFSDRFWVFAAATTNVEFTLRITDTDAGITQTYFNPLFSEAPPIQDTNAFDTCATPTTTTTSPISPPPMIDFVPSEAGSCVSSPTTLCLFSNRFAVTVDWLTQQTLAGDGFALPLTNQSGHFWFFNSNNRELLVNIYDGRTVNGNFWYFIGGLTNVEYHLHITDTVRGETRTYSNPQGIPATTVLDIGAGPPVPHEVPGLRWLAVLALSLLMGLAALLRSRRATG